MRKRLCRSSTVPVFVQLCCVCTAAASSPTQSHSLPPSVPTYLTSPPPPLPPTQHRSTWTANVSCLLLVRFAGRGRHRMISKFPSPSPVFYLTDSPCLAHIFTLCSRFSFQCCTALLGNKMQQHNWISTWATTRTGSQLNLQNPPGPTHKIWWLQDYIGLKATRMVPLRKHMHEIGCSWPIDFFGIK